jgi:type IV pilus assembly protein PilY1
VSGIASAFATVARRSGAVAAPATSNPNLVPGDNFLFTSTFTTLDWFSEVKRRQIDLGTGAISSTVDWTAQAQLDARTAANSDSRIIKTFDSANAATHLRSFAWANLTATEKTYFDGTLGGKNLLGQWPILTGAQQTQCDAGGTTCGEKLVNYLRGQRGFETTVVGNTTLAPDSGTNSLFRNRAHILGDIVNAEAVYVRQPIFNYGDQGYIAFKSAQTSRPGTLYTAANDGMLHALDANTGGERWTYIPTMVMPNMWHLADFDYANNHIYLVDGTPTTGDICTSNCSIASAAWATLLVGGLNAGGRGFYALDITDPLNPKALWELKSSATCIPSVNNVPQAPVPANTFSDCDIGLSFGNPIITQRADGKWVVLLSSGYNNVSPGTGGGFLYIVDAVTGAILSKVATLILNPPGFAPAMINAGNTTTPSGFAKINAFAAHTDNDNTSLRVYGGDLNGNLWRIDDQFTRNTLSGGVNQATLLAILGTANALNTQGTGTANTGSTQTVGSQSITTKPELGEILVSGVGTFEMVYVGTGRYLGTTDPAITNLQSFYGIKDPLGTFSGHGAVNGSSPNPNMVKQTITEVVNGSVTERHVTALTVNYTSKIGWFINFNPGTAPGVSPGERSNTDPSLDLGILSFTTNAPNVNACDVGGKSYIYFLDYTTGGPLPANLATGLGGQLLDNSLASRVVVIRVGDMVKGITVVGSQPDTPIETTLGPAANPVGGKRIYWRELNF